MITAQYEAACQEECGQPIEPGQHIEHRGELGGWRHVHCPTDSETAADEAALAQPRCTRCSLNHPGDC